MKVTPKKGKSLGKNLQRPRIIKRHYWVQKRQHLSLNFSTIENKDDITKKNREHTCGTSQRGEYSVVWGGNDKIESASATWFFKENERVDNTHKGVLVNQIFGCISIEEALSVVTKYKVFWIQRPIYQRTCCMKVFTKDISIKSWGWSRRGVHEQEKINSWEK